MVADGLRAKCEATGGGSGGDDDGDGVGCRQMTAAVVEIAVVDHD